MLIAFHDLGCINNHAVRPSFLISVFTIIFGKCFIFFTKKIFLRLLPKNYINFM